MADVSNYPTHKQTYEPIATQTLSAAASSVTFSNIPQTFKDLVLISLINPSTGGTTARVQFNSDTSSNYSDTEVYGSGSSALSTRTSNNSSILLAWTETNRNTLSTMSIESYSNINIYKTTLSDYSEPQSYVSNSVGLWRSTSSISSLKIFLANSNNMSIGSTFSLYGIAG